MAASAALGGVVYCLSKSNGLDKKTKQSTWMTVARARDSYLCTSLYQNTSPSSMNTISSVQEEKRSAAPLSIPVCLLQPWRLKQLNGFLAVMTIAMTFMETSRESTWHKEGKVVMEGMDRPD